MIRSSGDTQGEEIAHRYQQRRFVNLVCDARTIQTLHSLYALVTNPYSENPLLIANVVASAGFTGDNYAMFFESTIVSQFQNDLVICGVIIDNLAAQSLGLCRAIEESEKPAVHTISQIPCFCHTINLIFTNSIRDCPILHGVME
jgi:hypothetical protein